METMHERGLYVLNGKTIGNQEEEFTYIGARRYTIIGYIFVNNKLFDKSLKQRKGWTQILPVTISEKMEWKGTRGRREKDKMKTKTQGIREIICQNEDTYKEETDKIVWGAERED